MWRLLPDRCEMPGCERHGVRGNENIVQLSSGGTMRVCDYCHERLYVMRSRILRTEEDTDAKP